MYCYLYHQQTGIMPEYVGINHLLSGEILLAKLDLGIMASIVAYYEGIQDKIDIDNLKAKYTKKLPTDYNTPCLSRDFGGPVKGYCEFIESCWGNYYIDLLALEEKQVIS
jgi:hypothetical protein